MSEIGQAEAQPHAAPPALGFTKAGTPRKKKPGAGRKPGTPDPKHTIIDGKKLIGPVLRAVTGGITLKHATRPLSGPERESLSRALKMDVDEWRAQFSARLRAFGDDLLEHTHLKLKQIPPASLAYSLAVVIDKLGHLEGRNQVANAAVNMQVNNYFGAPGAKEMILSELDGSRMKDAISASTKPMQTFPSTNKQCDPEPTEQTEDSQSIVI